MTAESTSAALARVTKERDELAGIVSRKYGEIQDLQAELARLREHMRIQARVVVQRNAELYSARTELEQLRGEALYAYDAHWCETCRPDWDTRRPAVVANHPHPMTPVRVSFTRR